MTLFYYCVIDFEATCQREGVIPNQEIIEFPCVFVNSETLLPEFEFATYVRPEHNADLTAFCTELTGIEQHQVADAPRFSDALCSLVDFCTERGLDIYRTGTGAPLVCVTCGNWDLLTMLPAQCLLTGDRAPACLREWINVKAVADAVRGPRLRSTRSMPDMLDSLGLELVGRHHSGIDDARNIARILVALIADRGMDPLAFRTSRPPPQQQPTKEGKKGKRI